MIISKLNIIYNYDENIITVPSVTDQEVYGSCVCILPQRKRSQKNYKKKSLKIYFFFNKHTVNRLTVNSSYENN